MNHKKQGKKGGGNSNEFLNSLNKVISEARNMVSKSPKVDIIQKEAVNIVEGFFYSNLITNFKNNLTEDNLKELKITKEEVNKINKEFSRLFERCDNTLDEGSNKEKINHQVYQEFKERLSKISKNSHKLLVEIEKHIDIGSCNKVIRNFKEDIKTLGKELKIGTINQDGKFGISIGFDSEKENEDSEESEYSEEITDFNNFSLSIDGEWVTIEDRKGYFFGQYNISNNKKYLIAYCDAHLEVDKKGQESTISGQVYLIQDQKKILWKKDIGRPIGAFVTNEGICIIIDELAFKKELSSKLYFFNRNGKKLMEYQFNSNIGGQEISRDGKEIIITTCFPENAIYLFDIQKARLIKKVENNTSKRPLVNFRFDEIKKYIVKTEPFNQEQYELQKQKEKQEVEEDKKRIESLKKKRITDLNYDELVEIGSIYAGDFYGNFGEPKKALNYLLKAIELKREKPQPYVLKMIGFCYEKIKDYKTAIKYYKEALNRYPPYKKSIVVDHLEFCNLKLNKKLNEDWISFIIKKREKERSKK